MRRHLALIPVLLITLLATFGCKDEGDERDEPIIPPPSVVSRVVISPVNDTIPALPGDTATALLTVTVLDQDEIVMPGVAVHLEVTDTAAFLEFTDDSTNALGRVEVLFYSTWWRDHLNVVTATAGGLHATARIYTCDNSFSAPELHMTVSPTELVLGTDSMLVEVTLTDGYGNPGAFLSPLLSAPYGQFTPVAWTDSAGYTSAYWFPSDTGEVWIEASFQWHRYCRTFPLSDITWVQVTSPEYAPVGQVHIFAPDTLHIEPPDTATAQVQVLVTSETGTALPGRRVQISLGNPGIGYLEFTDPALQDMTNEFGRVNMRYTALAAGLQTIYAACDTIAAPPHEIVTLGP